MSRVLREFESLLDCYLRVMGRAPAIDLLVDSTVREKPRHFAAVDLSSEPYQLFVHPDLEDQPLQRIRGILAHEFGHVADAEGMTCGCRICRGDLERLADCLAEVIFGVRIVYDDEDVQQVGRRTRGRWPRPKGL